MFHARPRAATAALALTALLLAGCAEPAAEPPPAPTTAPTATPSSTPTATDVPTEPADPAADVLDTTSWLEFVTDDGTIAFRYPPEWTLESSSEWFSPDADRDDVEDPYARWIDSATLTAPNGQRLLQMTDFVDIGGACGDGPAPLEVLAVEASQSSSLDGPEAVIATVAIDFGAGSGWAMGIGVTDPGYVEHDTACTFYFVGASSDGGASFGTHFQMGSTDPLWMVDSLDDARAYMETAEYATIIEILRSYRTH